MQHERRRACRPDLTFDLLADLLATPAERRPQRLARLPRLPRPLLVLLAQVLLASAGGER